MLYGKFHKKNDLADVNYAARSICFKEHFLYFKKAATFWAV